MTRKSDSGNPVFKIVEVVGTSHISWEDAARSAF